MLFDPCSPCCSLKIFIVKCSGNFAFNGGGVPFAKIIITIDGTEKEFIGDATGAVDISGTSRNTTYDLVIETVYGTFNKTITTNSSDNQTLSIDLTASNTHLCCTPCPYPMKTVTGNITSEFWPEVYIPSAGGYYNTCSFLTAFPRSLEETIVCFLEFDNLPLTFRYIPRDSVYSNYVYISDIHILGTVKRHDNYPSAEVDANVFVYAAIKCNSQAVVGFGTVRSVAGLFGPFGGGGTYHLEYPSNVPTGMMLVSEVVSNVNMSRIVSEVDPNTCSPLEVEGLGSWWADVELGNAGLGGNVYIRIEE